MTKGMVDSLYDILGVAEGATIEAIKHAYKKLAQKLHPDKNDGETNEEFKRLQKAYMILSDPEKRQRYDTMGDDSGKPERSPQSKANEYIVSLVFSIIGNFGESSVDHMDVMTAVKKKIRQDTLGATSAIKKINRKIKVFEKAKKRFKGDKAGIILMAINATLDELNMGVAGIEEKIALYELALEIIEDIDYEFEPSASINPYSSMPSLANSFTNTNWTRG